MIPSLVQADNVSPPQPKPGFAAVSPESEEPAQLFQLLLLLLQTLCSQPPILTTSPFSSFPILRHRLWRTSMPSKHFWHYSPLPPPLPISPFPSPASVQPLPNQTEGALAH